MKNPIHIASSVKGYSELNSRPSNACSMLSRASGSKLKTEVAKKTPPEKQFRRLIAPVNFVEVPSFSTKHFTVMQEITPLSTERPNKMKVEASLAVATIFSIRFHK
jgi:hypothetical protein